MARKSVTAGVPRLPPAEVRFELAAGLPADLPQVGKPVRLEVSGMLSKVAKDEYGNRDCISVRSPHVKLIKGR